MKFRVRTSQGDFVIEANKQPTESQVREAIGKQQSFKGRAEQGIRTASKALPTAGAVAGGVLGQMFAPGVVGRVTGETLGAGAGKVLEQQVGKDPLSAAGRVGASTLEAAGGVTPIAAAIRQQTGGFAQQTTPEEVGDVLGTAAGTAGLSLAGEGIFAGVGALFRGGKGVIAKQVLPRAEEAFKNTIRKLPPALVEQLVKFKKVPKDAITHLKKKTVDVVRANASKFKSAGDFVERIKDGIANKTALANQAEKEAFASVPQGRSINVNKWVDSTRKRLQKFGRLTKAGRPSPTGQQVAKQGNVLDEIVDLMDDIGGRQKEVFKQKPVKTTVTELLPGATTGKPTPTPVDVIRKVPRKQTQINFNAEESALVRDRLRGLFGRATPTEKQVLKDITREYVNTLDNGGVTGLRAANKQFSSAARLEKEFVDSFGNLKKISESSIEKAFKSDVRKKALKRVATEIGDPTLVDDVLDFASDKILRDYEATVPKEKIFNELLGSLDKEKTEVSKDFLRKFFGEETDDIINTISSFRKGRTVRKAAGVAGAAEVARRGAKAVGSVAGGQTPQNILEF